MKKGIIAFITINIVSSTSFGQSLLTDNISVNSSLSYGLLLPEYSYVSYLAEAPLTAIDIGISKRTKGKNLWEQIYKYPEYGLTFFYTTLGNKNVFGNEFAIYPSISFFVINRPKIKLSNEMGLGLGYATKRFHLKDNYQNVSVGSHLNMHFNYKLKAHFILSSRLSLNTGLSFAHFSNANMAEPNLGLNMVYAFSGINFLLSPPVFNERLEIQPHEAGHEFAFVVSPGGKHTRALQSKVYFTSSLSTEYKYHWKRKLHLGCGIDLFYDSSTRTEMSVSNANDYKSGYDFKSGIHISQEFVYNQFSLILQEGIYIGLIDRLNNSWEYNRAIVRWKFSNHFFIHASMKSHLHILDYPELGFGYYL